MNKKINMLLRILGISILFLNIGSITGNAADSNVYVNTVGTHVYIDGVYKGDVNRGLFQTTLPAFTTHTLRVTGTGLNDFVTTFKVKAGYMIIAAPMWPAAWNTPAPTPTATPTPTSTPTPYYTPKPTSTPVPYYTPTPTSSGKYIELKSEPSGANVYYGSTLIGTTPFTYKLPFTQRITFKLPGYNDKITYVEQLTRSPFKVYLAKSFI